VDVAPLDIDLDFLSMVRSFVERIVGDGDGQHANIGHVTPKNE
jgi:hypothetical protein